MCPCKLQIIIITEWFCDWWSTTWLWLKSPQLGDQFQQCVWFMPLFAMRYMYKRLQITIIITETFCDEWSTTWLWLMSPQFRQCVHDSCNCLPCSTCTRNCRSLLNEYVSDDQYLTVAEVSSACWPGPAICVIHVTVYMQLQITTEWLCEWWSIPDCGWSLLSLVTRSCSRWTRLSSASISLPGSSSRTEREQCIRTCDCKDLCKNSFSQISYFDHLFGVNACSLPP